MQDLEKAKHFLDKHIETKLKEAQYRAEITNGFLNANEVDYLERDVISSLMLFEDGQFVHLENAARDLEHLINQTRAALQ